MKLNCFTGKLILALALIFSTAVPVFAEENDLAEVQKSMKARLKDMVTMKKDGKIGENNLGYLTARSSDEKVTELVKEENADRKIVYDTIATKQKVSSKFIGQARAKQIAEKSRDGEWLKSTEGKWYQKGSADDPAKKK